MGDRIERVRQALAMRDADYDVRPDIEDIGNLLHQYDRLHAELANARLERDNIAFLNSSLIAELAVTKDYARTCAGLANIRETELAARDARIAELETDHLFAENKRLREACQEFRARAERAEDALKEQLETKKWYTDRAEELEAHLQRVVNDYGFCNARAERAETEYEAVLHLYAEAQRWATGTEEHRLALQKADIARAALTPSPTGEKS